MTMSEIDVSTKAEVTTFTRQHVAMDLGKWVNYGEGARSGTGSIGCAEGCADGTDHVRRIGSTCGQAHLLVVLIHTCENYNCVGGRSCSSIECRV